MVEALRGHMMPLVLRSMNTLMNAKAGVNIDQVTSGRNSIAGLPWPRKKHWKKFSIS